MTIQINGTTGISGVDGSAATPALQGSDANTGVFFGTDEVKISTGGTEAITVDASQRVGIGTTAPVEPLQVKGNISVGDGSASSIDLRFHSTGGDGTVRLRGEGDTLQIYTGNAERMRIDNAGNVGINVTNPSAGASATSGLAVRPGSHDVWFNHANGVGSGTAYAYFSYNSGAIGSITQNGTTAVAYNTTSDYRLKENVTAITDGIARLQQLKPCKFNFIAEPDRAVDGFIAHEVQQVIPEAITGEKDAVDDEGKPVYQGIDQSKLVPLLTAALQEAITRIETLEAEVQALKGGN